MWEALVVRVAARWAITATTVVVLPASWDATEGLSAAVAVARGVILTGAIAA